MELLLTIGTPRKDCKDLAKQAMRKFTNDQRRRAVDVIIVLLPLLAAVIWLYCKPYYMFVLSGDPDYHLPRAREILESPMRGMSSPKHIQIGFSWIEIVYNP